MNSKPLGNNISVSMANNHGERGSAIVIALFMLALISVFVAMALSRSSAEAAATGNETAEARTFYAAQGSLETMTRNFNKVFEIKLNPATIDLDNVRNGPVAGLGNYTFFQELDRIDQGTAGTIKTLTGGPFSGLVAIQDNWRLRTTATNNNGTTANPMGTQVQLTRNILNNRIPIFQFGVFYNDDLELFRPPRFSFGGRVHSNGNFFLSPGTEGVYFDSRVTAADQIITQTWRNWDTGDAANNQTFIKNASGTFVQLTPTMGSVLNTTEGASNNIFQFPPAVPVPAQTPNLDLPPSRINPNFLAQTAVFDGNLQAHVPELKLPLNVGSDTDLIEMLRRPKEIALPAGGDLFSNAGILTPVTAATQDNFIMRNERFANKTGIRISLADSQAKLPGCASGSGVTPVAARCGVRLDGRTDGTGPDPTVAPTPSATPDRARGYQPKPMKRVTSDTNFTTNPYRSTRLNGERFWTGGGREVWIKVETVRTDATTQAIVTVDITEDFLSMGVTEQAAQIADSDGTIRFRITDTRYDNGTVLPTSLTATTPQIPASNGTDSRSVIKLQRFVIPGPQIPTSSPTPFTSYVAVSNNSTFKPGFNLVQRYSATTQTLVAGCKDVGASGSGTVCGTALDGDAGLERTLAFPSDALNTESWAHLKLARVGTATSDKAVVPFPIKIFDMREGYYYDERSSTYYATFNSQLPRNGVMSLIDIDVANLRRFLRGDFNGLFPIDTPYALSNGGTGLTSAAIPQENGWVVYFSDRRGDADFDGEYDMEDIYGNSLSGGGPNNGTMQLGEDVNRNSILDAKYMTASSLTGCQGIVSDCEAPKYVDTWFPDFSAVTDHKYYRRGFRLINGVTLPGVYDAVNSGNTRGFTVASENGVYILGNYNSTGANAPPAQGNTPFNLYSPFNTPLHIPASIVADAVTILSNNWNDSQSFSSPVTSPYDQSTRLATNTQMRFAMISGDTIASRSATPHQGGISPRLNGGVHNFKRFLERWTNQRLDYSGSLVNLFNSRNNNGSFKCCNEVYNPPIRNWVFDSTFLDPARLPPGTPFFQYVQTTGFLRTND